MNNPNFPPNPVLLPYETNYVNPTQTVTTMPAIKRTKSEHQIDKIVFYISDPKVNQGKIHLRKSVMNARYIVYFSTIIFLGDEELINLIKSDSYFHTHDQLTDKQINLAIQIISGRSDLWIKDSEEDRFIPCRVMPLPGKGFVYYFNKIYWFASDSRPIFVKNYVPQGTDAIQTPSRIESLYAPIKPGYQYNPCFKVLESLFYQELNVSKDHVLPVLTWLIQCIIGKDYTLLEITGESGKGKTRAQSTLRQIIDPHLELWIKAPKSIMELEQQAFEGYVMSYDDVEILPKNVQTHIADLMSVDGIKLAPPVGRRDSNGHIFVHRPFILNAVDPVVTDQKLLNKTITIEMKNTPSQWRISKIDKNIIDLLRIEVLKLAVAISYYNPLNDSPRCNCRNLQEFSDIGCALSQIVYGTTNVFENQFNLLIEEQLLASLNENCSASLVYFWAINNSNTTKEIALIDFLDEVVQFRDERLKQPTITPKQFGVDLRKYAHILRQFGIDCIPDGKRGSYCKWRITTAEKIGLQGSFFLDPSNSTVTHSTSAEHPDVPQEIPTPRPESPEETQEEKIAANQNQSTSTEDSSHDHYPFDDSLLSEFSLYI